jgi:hypothetical protein
MLIHIRYKSPMAALRRALFALLATSLLLFGFGSFTAALACPTTYVAVTDHSDCCGTGEQEDCVLLTCTAICHAVAPSAAATPNNASLEAAPVWGETPALESPVTGPEPPPPRSA